MAVSDERVTLSDIAQRSGVSIATVSLALNNRPGISAETRARILELAQAMGYPVKPALPVATANRLQTLGMVVKADPTMAPEVNPFYSKIIYGIEEACRRHGINLMFSRVPVDSDNRALELPAMLEGDIVDGLLLVGIQVENALLSSKGTRPPPIVLVDSYCDQDCYDTVVSDNFGGAYQTVEYLLKHGHRHIAFIGGEPNAYPSIRLRRNGYLRALKDNNLPNTYLADFNINCSYGYQETRELLQVHPEITAVFGVNDNVAVTALRTARDMGRTVPRDLSVIGYDDTILASSSSPALTVMHVDIVAMGLAAVQLMTFRLENPDIDRVTLTIHPTLVERESVATCSAS